MHDQMLESNRDDVKLEAMRCVTVMTAKGKLTVPRTLFPHIVKNISSKNPELKKLIYLYLTNFADQEPDLALLPVATLQKSLKSPNPLIRSSALKVLTSMRLNILSGILMATLRNSVNDLSPYVRKTVAHSIIKIYRLDPSLRGDLIEYIERLFNDKNSMVLSSAVATFEVVCPEKLDLVHKHYRRFCFILADCNEWGQTVFLNLLVRYIIKTYGKGQTSTITDYNPSEHDPKILLRSAKPLLHSNNSAVVMGVVKLFIAIANNNEVRSTITKPLLRLLNSRSEIQLMVLNFIEELTTLENNSIQTDEESEDEEDEKDDKNDKNEKENGYNEEKNEIVIEKENQKQNEKQNVIEIQDQFKNDNENVIENQERNEDESGDDDEDGSANEDETVDEDEDDSDSEDESGSEEEEDDEEENDEEIEKEIEKENEKKVKESSDLIDLDANKDPNAFREIFRPHIKSFFVKHTDSTQIRLAKLKILTNLSSSVNVTLVLKELQAYISAYVEDQEFVSAAIHAIGRCAIIVKEVAHTCLNGLTTLLSNNNEHIVSEAIVVLRSQIINKKSNKKLNIININKLSNGNSNNNTDENDFNQSNEKTKNENDNSIKEDNNNKGDDKIVSTVIRQVTKLLPTITAPQARATILWILAEFCDKNLTAAKCSPEVLRSIAKSFCQEDNFVKLESLTLASKFLLSLDKEKKAELYHKVQLLTGYLFSLAKYDINHDVRDRGRFLKKLLDDEEICSKVLNCIPVN